MKINATPAELQAANEALKLSAILDDRAPAADKPRIAAWAEQIHRHNLTEADLLDGVQAFYDSPSERAIQVGDLIHHARHAKRSRVDREADQVREKRQEALDVKAADEIHGLAAGVVLGPAKNRTPRLQAAENALQCVFDKTSAKAAIAEYLAAKRQAQGKRAKASA